MNYIKTDADGVVIQKQGYWEEGFEEVPDWVGCGMVADGDGGYAVPPPAPAPAPTVDDFHQWLYEHLDEVAQADRWDNRITLMQRASYDGIWKPLADSFCAHVNTCEAAALAYLQSGAPLPASKAAFIAMLPVWERQE